MKLPTLPKMPFPSRQYFKVGDYYLHYFGNDYWIEADNGEGMQVSKAVLEKMIADYYRENF